MEQIKTPEQLETTVVEASGLNPYREHTTAIILLEHLNNIVQCSTETISDGEVIDSIASILNTVLEAS